MKHAVRSFFVVFTKRIIHCFCNVFACSSIKFSRKFNLLKITVAPASLKKLKTFRKLTNYEEK